MILNVAGSKHSLCKDIRKLRYEYTLPEFLELKEYVDMMTAFETAVHMDQEAEQEASSNKQ